MALFKVLSLVVLVGAAFADQGVDIKPCAVTDLDCLGKSLEAFLKVSSEGEAHKYGLKTIDPIFIDMVCQQGGKDVMLHYKNITLTGMKGFKLSKFNYNKVIKEVEVTSYGPVDIAATLVVELTDVSKTFSGSYSAKANVAATFKYTLSVNKDDKGVEHYVINPTRSIETLTTPEVKLGQDLVDALNNDVDAAAKKEDFIAHRDEIRTLSFSRIVDEAYVAVVYNLKTFAQLVPTTAFFSGI